MEYIGKTILLEEEGKKILVVGDLHLGYEESLERSGVLAGRKYFDEMIKDFDLVFSKVGKVDTVCLLGDVKHNFSGNLRQEWNDALELFEYLLKHCSGIKVIRGNHDNYLMTITGKVKKTEVVESYVVGDTGFVHGNKEVELDVKRIVMGHGHPAVKISDGTKTEKYKCFLVGKWKKKEIIVVPSFAEYYQGSDPEDSDLEERWGFDLEKFEVKVVNGLEALGFGKLKDLK